MSILLVNHWSHLIHKSTHIAFCHTLVLLRNTRPLNLTISFWGQYAIASLVSWNLNLFVCNMLYTQCLQSLTFSSVTKPSFRFWEGQLFKTQEKHTLYYILLGLLFVLPCVRIVLWITFCYDCSLYYLLLGLFFELPFVMIVLCITFC